MKISSFISKSTQTLAKKEHGIHSLKAYSIPKQLLSSVITNKRTTSTLRRRKFIFCDKPIIVILLILKKLDLDPPQLLRFQKQNELRDNGFSHFRHKDRNFEHFREFVEDGQSFPRHFIEHLLGKVSH
ncbi:hypothetical protein PanWU01x14_019060 [Parasponia andersonii]|uniref:Uncharacterized protein n=1 Tax=Parasponia andersonii TaxID=3476 RepID=A0A2P5DZC2_PARAD|nr:hypothetical protein PanWU01x14_019060 [Parasponia andersonii]